ncbi:hypothetical protein BDR07DRAFT_1283520 [Suillus spraguei]|nr:hypothetical protein BDR07DRAFT_1283520 [Suillus spraguei]
MATTEVTIEFKWSKTHDTFCECDNGASFISQTEKGIDTLGQITSYTAVQLTAQYHTHTFSVFIIQHQACIIRWDSEGAVVTSPIHYNTEPHLADFFYRYSKASPELHGVDTSVMPASEKESDHARQRLNLDTKTHMLKVQVPTEDSSLVALIIPAPVATGLLPVGCGTYTCPAYDHNKDRIVMFKDSWRVSLPHILPEGETYKQLKAANVVNVATCIACHNVPSIPQQLPQSIKFSSADWACPHNTLTPHSHYRLVLNVVGEALTNFPRSRQLVEVVWDALLAHKDAYEKAGILHRDLSIGNIVMFRGKGILIDWDLAKLGTWQFMSAYLVQNQNAPHVVKDDLESSLYVILWAALKYSRTHMTDARCLTRM